MNAPTPFTRAGPPALEGLLVFGTKFSWIASQIGVSEMTVSRWYRGQRGMTAGQALFLTSLLAMMIEAGGQGLDGDELSDRDKQALRIKLNTASAWHALQGLANQELPDGCEHEALALRDAQLGALRRRLTPTNGGPPRRHAEHKAQKRETHAPKLAGQGVGSVARNTPVKKGASDAP